MAHWQNVLFLTAALCLAVAHGAKIQSEYEAVTVSQMCSRCPAGSSKLTPTAFCCPESQHSSEHGTQPQQHSTNDAKRLLLGPLELEKKAFLNHHIEQYGYNGWLDRNWQQEVGTRDTLVVGQCICQCV